MWTKICGLLLTMIGYYAIKSKLQARKIENLEQKNAHNEKLQIIDEVVEFAEIQAEAKENEAIKDFDDSDWDKHI